MGATLGFEAMRVGTPASPLLANQPHENQIDSKKILFSTLVKG
jgi:hypothetical protein